MSLYSHVSIDTMKMKMMLSFVDDNLKHGSTRLIFIVWINEEFIGTKIIDFDEKEFKFYFRERLMASISFARDNRRCFYANYSLIPKSQQEE
jgi:hypothetical protein